MEILQLKTFVTIAKVGSFTKAAELLGYAQSSVSGQIRALEDDLECRVFERLGREVMLTEEGKQLLTYAEQMIKLAEETKDSIAGNSIPRGTVTIGAPETLSIFRLPSILKEYRRCFPKVKLILKLGSCNEILDWLKKNIIDIAFLLDTPLNLSDFISECLYHEEIALIAGNDHALIYKNPLETIDLDGEEFILVEEDSCCYRTIFESILSESGARSSSVQEIGNVETIKKCVISGLGISILPRIAVEQELLNGQLKELAWNAPEFNIYMQILYHKNKWLSPALSAIIELSKQSSSLQLKN